ncbi:OmpP1/FadL family transporter [Hyphomicrobium sp.]|jgi:long-chain fatty acid transport protein|uniref:OmpP1/FadL family transporter n=1 Tax=Hyphomicrobium sp. TaxID=82 RepID=UPI002B9B6316|nr:outer membrane protein transport protein [Hyphomicrobium sp.]HVZ06023.1 outer membrane protein transport protein [Hyphomicrobium sp.]
MPFPRYLSHALRVTGVVSAAMALASPSAFAGGFDIHEQSTVFMGSASAGSAAGGSLGSMFWNPAATGQFPGFNTESSYTLVLPYGDIDIKNSPLGTGRSGNIGIDATTSDSYGAYQFAPDLWLGMAITSPFGLATKPENINYPGSYLGVTSKLLTINANPTIAYRVAPGITIGAGVQIEWAQGKLQFRDSPGTVAQFGGTDWAFGGTAGITLQPTSTTTIGVGYRSQMTHDLDGTFHSDVLTAGTVVPAVGTIDLPDIVTASLRQEMTPTTRLLGTVQWSNWSRFKDLTLTTPGGSLKTEANWDDGWFFSVGGEYDYSPSLTLRSGVAYELSPIDSATKRLVQIPDNNRVWLSFGASYKWSEAMTIDIAYSHMFIEDGGVDLYTPTGIGPFQGDVEAAVDLFSVGLRTKW